MNLSRIFRSGITTIRQTNELHYFFSTSSPRGIIEIDDKMGIRKISLNDSKTRNSLSKQMMCELIEGIEKGKNDKSLRCISISAKGPVFSAGHNLKELTKDNGEEKQKEIFKICSKLMLTIRNSPVPVIAIVEGLAAAAGCQMVAACDFAIGTPSAKFSTPGASFGVFCTTPGISVSRVVGQSMAAYMVLTGRPLTAEEALRAGLIVQIFSENELEEKMEDIYSNISSKSRPILKNGKEFFYKQLGMNYEDALKCGEEEMVKNLQLKDSQEGLSSFKEKRKPIWTHEEN